MSRDPVEARKALLAHPLIGQDELATALLEQLAEAERWAAAGRRGRRDDRLALAVDGGNSKTDLALILADGTVLSAVRGPGSSQQRLGVEGSIEVLGELLERAAADAGVSTNNGPVAEVGRVLIAGADLPEEEAALRKALMETGWAPRTDVANDTFAVLRAGTDLGWGVALVCGAGMNCVGVAEDGRVVRFAALGRTTGAGAAARTWGSTPSGRRRGVPTVAVPTRASRLPYRPTSPSRLPSTSRARFTSASWRRSGSARPRGPGGGDAGQVAREIVERLKVEMIDLVRVAISALEMNGRPFEVILGGGLFRADGGGLVEAVCAGVGELAPGATVKAIDAHPIVGAALLALDELDSEPAAKERVRRSLGAVIDRIDIHRFSTGQARRDYADGEERVVPWLRFATSRPRRSIPGRRFRRSSPWTCRSPTAS